jgi:hypothetical protein
LITWLDVMSDPSEVILAGTTRDKMRYRAWWCPASSQGDSEPVEYPEQRRVGHDTILAASSRCCPSIAIWPGFLSASHIAQARASCRSVSVSRTSSVGHLNGPRLEAGDRR